MFFDSFLLKTGLHTYFIRSSSQRQLRLYRMGKGGVPERWTDYSKIGNVIKTDSLNTRLISFRVPLKESITKELHQRERWTPDDLVEEITSRGLKLGLVIDLTFTNRYYNGQVFRDQGIEHVKIKCEGQMVPRLIHLNRFIEEVNNFLASNHDENTVIGVHCTHGVNRTGYIISRYLVKELGIKPEEAIEMVNKARGHNQEREIYLKHIKTGQLPKEEETSYYSKAAELRTDFRHVHQHNRQNNRVAPYSRPDRGQGRHNMGSDKHQPSSRQHNELTLAPVHSANYYQEALGSWYPGPNYNSHNRGASNSGYNQSWNANAGRGWAGNSNGQQGWSGGNGYDYSAQGYGTYSYANSNNQNNYSQGNRRGRGQSSNVSGAQQQSRCPRTSGQTNSQRSNNGPPSSQNRGSNPGPLRKRRARPQGF